MTDDTPSSPAATPSGNQNLIIGLVLGAVVLLLFLLVLQMTGGGFGSSSSSEMDQLKAERDALRAKRVGTADPDRPAGQSAEALATRLSKDSNTLAGLVTKMQTLLAQREDELKSTRSLYQHTSRDLEQVRQQLATTNVNAAEIDSLRRQLSDTQALLNQAESLATQLRQQAASAPSQSAVTQLRSELEVALRQRDTFQQQLNDLKNQLQNSVDSSQADALSREVAELQSKSDALATENNKLEYELQQVRAQLDRTRLFVEEADDLPAAAKALYAELSKLESKTPEELTQEYERLDEELRATVVDRIEFQTGSSRIDLDKAEEIRRAVQSSGDQSLFLVVGYASKSGQLAANRKLSADRATTIASVANLEKKTGQNVQAVFLSATDRFSPTDLARNQVCEVWEIKK